VAVLGSFSGSPISAQARSALQRLLAWKLSLHGAPSTGRTIVRVNPGGARYSRFPARAHVSLPRIAGHRDADSTDCPGAVLYHQLGAIRRNVSALAPSPARLTMKFLVPAPVPSVTGAEPPPPLTGATLQGSFSLLGGAPIASARVLIQARTVRGRGQEVVERTVAEATSDGQGRWSVPASDPTLPPGKLALRALCTGGLGYGAAVSVPLTLTVAAPAPAPAPPPASPPPPAPAPGAPLTPSSAAAPSS
jgi:hypothetical protein